jgi:hypothetical protein
MAAALVPDALWSLIRPLLPASMPKPQGGRPADYFRLARDSGGTMLTAKNKS